LRVLASSPEVLTPIMNNCPACCSVVRESAFARHFIVSGVGEGEGDESGSPLDVAVCEASVMACGAREFATGSAEQPTRSDAQVAATAIRGRRPQRHGIAFFTRVRCIASVAVITASALAARGPVLFLSGNGSRSGGHGW
jgi:hypothetical protein